MELFVQGAGKEAKGLSHGNHGAADRHAVIFLLRGKVEACGYGHEGLARPRLSIAGDKRNRGVKKGIEEAELPEIGRLQLDSARHLEARGNTEPDKVTAADMTRRHELLLRGREEDIFVDLKRAGAACIKVQALGTAEALEFMRFDNNGTDFKLLGILGGDLVIEVILAVDPKCHCLELHIEIFGDENGGDLFTLLEGKTGCHDPVINRFLIGKDLCEAPHGRRGAFPAERVIHEDPNRPSSRSFHTPGDFLGLVIEGLGQEAVNGAGIGTALGLLVLKAIKL